jgi:ELWxxDGT repeat protein
MNTTKQSFSLIWLFFCAFCTLFAQTPTLVKDLRIPEPGTGSKVLIPVPLGTTGTILAFGSGDGYGKELFRYNTANSTYDLVKDIRPGSMGSLNTVEAFNFRTIPYIVLNNVLYFIADDGVNGAALWKSDGTAAGTVLAKVISTSPKPVVENFRDMAVLNGKIIFSSGQKFQNDPAFTNQILSFDPVSNALTVIKSFPITYGIANNFKIFAGNLYFFSRASNDIFNNTTDLYKSDGTVAGTVKIGTVDSYEFTEYRSATLVEWNAQLWFLTKNANSGDTQLWKTNGTAAGTVLVLNRPGTYGAFLTVVGNQLFWFEYFGGSFSGGKLVKSDGTSAGTVNFSTSGFNFFDLTSVIAYNGKWYFGANETSTGTAKAGIYVADGLSTSLVKDVFPGTSSAGIVGIVNNKLIFSEYAFNNDEVPQPTTGEVWSTDGVSQTRLAINNLVLNNVYPLGQTVVNNGILYFPGPDAWSSDGTPANTRQYLYMPPISFPSSSPINFGDLGVGKSLFSAIDYLGNIDIYTTDGSTNGTIKVKDTPAQNPGAAISQGPIPQYVAIGNGSYLIYFNDFSSGSGGIWVTNGTSSGTYQLITNFSTFNTNDPNLAARSVVSGGRAYLAENEKIYITNGETIGTSIPYTVANSGTTIMSIVLVGNNIFWSERTSANALSIKKADLNFTSVSTHVTLGTGNRVDLFDINGKLGYIWHDRTAGKIKTVVETLSGFPEFNVPSNTFFSTFPKLISLNNGVLLKTYPSTAYQVIGYQADVFAWWFNNGTSSTMLNDFGSGAKDIVVLGKLGSKVIFKTLGFNNLSNEPWVTDGTSAGTFNLKDIIPGNGFIGESDPVTVKNDGANLYFTALRGTTLYSVWQTNGTVAGTTKLADLPANATNTGAVLNGFYVFAHDDGTVGRELYRVSIGSAPNACSPDVTNPIIANCPANISLTTTGSTAIATWIPPTATDACSATTLIGTQTSGAFFGIGSTTVTYTAFDAASNTAVCNFTVTISNQPTGGGCAGNLLTNNGFESDFGSWENPNGATIVTDAQAGTKAMSLCPTGAGRVYQFKTATAGTNYTFKAFCKKTGTAPTNIFIKFMNAGFSPLQTDFQQITSTTYTEVTLTKLAPTGAAYMEIGFIKDNGTGCLLADEACLITGGGNGNPCSPDVVGPTIFGCPSNITLTTTATSATTTWTPPTATDACSTTTISSNFNSGASFPIGSTTVVYTARDVANNATTCSFIVTVTAVQPPTSCIDNLLNNGNFESSFASWENPNNATIEFDPQIASNAMRLCTFVPSRVYQFKTATAGTTYTFKASCKTGSAAATNIFIKFMNAGFSPIQTDFQPITSATYTVVSLTKLAPTGTVYMEVGFIKDNGAGCFLADDACLTTGSGNGNPCAPDILAPTIAGCPSNINLTTTAASSTATWTAPTATDNCGTPTLTSNFNSGVIFPIGSTTVTYTARDGANNTSTCNFVVTVTQSGSGNLADLNVINLNVPTTTIAAGSVINYSFTARNTGTLTTGNFSIKAYFSTDNLLSTNDIQDGTINTGNFTPGTANVVNGASTVPASLAAGNYFLIVKIDADNQVIESNENNNNAASVSSFAVTNGGGSFGADLQVTITADKSQVAQWNNVAYTIVAKNNGNANISSATIKVGGCNTAGFQTFSNAFGLVYAGAPGQPSIGNFNSISQEWSISNLAAGQSSTFNLILFSTGTAERKVVAFCSVQSPNDPDSQPSSTLSNCTPTQDDEAVWTINAGQTLLATGIRQEIKPLDATQIADYQLFPNPAGEILNVDLTQWMGKSGKLIFINQLGKVVFEKTFENIQTPIETMDLSGFNNGQYFVKMETAGQRTQVKRLVVSRMY